MKQILTKGFINIGGVNYLSKTTYGRHKVILTFMVSLNTIQIKFIHNEEYKDVKIDDEKLTLIPFNPHHPH